MKRASLLFVFAGASLTAAACGSRVPTDEAAPPREGLSAKIKCQTPGGSDAGAGTTVTYTATATQTATTTSTATSTSTATGIKTSTATATTTSTSVHTITETVTETLPGTATTTTTATDTSTAPATATQTATATVTGVDTQTLTLTETLTNIATNTVTLTQTLTDTVTETVTNTLTITDSWTSTNTVTNTSTSSGTLTRTYTASRVNSGSVSSLWTFTGSGTHTIQLQSTNTGTSFVTNNMQWGPGSATLTGLRANVTMTGTDSASRTATYAGSESGTATASWTQPMNNASYTWTGTANNTAARIVTGTATWTYTQNRVLAGTWTGSATFTRTGTGTMSSTSTGTATAIQTSTATVTETAAETFTNTSSETSTATETELQTSSTTSTGTATVPTTNTGTTTETVSTTDTMTVTTTFTETSTVPGTDTTSSTYTHTRVETDTNTGTVTNTETVSWTNTNTATNTVTSTVTVTSTQTKTSTTDGGVPSGCLQDWRNSGPCGEWCLRETQSDRQACKVFLDCYRDHDCGPSTCGGQDDVCGVNKFSYGMAPKTIADQVYACLACPGSAPVTSCSNYPDTTPCTDGNACTRKDTCQAGECRGEDPVSCPSPDQCHQGVCDPETGACSSPPKQDGTPCDDGNKCTSSDACQGGICTGIGSGFVGPGEKCAPSSPASPGPFGDFRCLLEEVPGTDKNLLVLGTGATAEARILRGSIHFSLTAQGAKATNLSLTGQASSLDLQSGIVLVLDRNGSSSGTVDMSTGDVQMTMPALVLHPDGTTTALAWTLTGKVADRVLQGQLSSTAETPAQAKLFCREQFMETVASVIFTLDEMGDFLGLGPISIFPGTPPLPRARSIPAPGDLVAEQVSLTGEILDQYGIGKPWTVTWPSAPLPTPANAGNTSVAVEIRAPLSNRLGAIVLRSSSGSLLATADLTPNMTTFCAGVGSQYCDYRAGTPVRQIFYAPGKPAPALKPAFPTNMLPSSPRLEGNETILTTDHNARQPDIGLDADGNAIITWRQDYDDIMAMGVSKNGATLFGPIKVNDKDCVIGWVPGYPHPDRTEEYGTYISAKPMVAVSNTARKSSGDPDRTFAVVWGSFVDLIWNKGKVVTATILCSRLFEGDGTPVEDPVMVEPGQGSDDTYAVIPDQTYASVAITESHEFVIAWHEFPQDTERYRVSARRFGADGLPKSERATVVSSDNSKHASYPTVAMDGTGRATIVWRLHPGANPLEGRVNMQRFSNAFSKVGTSSQVSNNLVVGIPAVAMRSDNGDIIITAGSKDGDIYAGTYRFSDAQALDAWSRMNARTAQVQERPVVSVTGNGGYLLAWMDEAGSDPNFVHPITAEVYASSGRPLDIDFTVSTQTLLYTDNSIQNPDFYMGPPAFAFRAAASQDEYVFVWQRPLVNRGSDDDPDYEGGIVLQRIEAGPPPCPLPTGQNCGTALPLRVAGATKDKIDVILSPGKVVHDDTGEDLPNFTTPYTSAAEFGRKAVDLIVNGYLANNGFPVYFNEFNFYYDMSQGVRRMIHDMNGRCVGLRGDSGSTVAMGAEALKKALGYSGNNAFANVAGVVFRKYTPPGECTSSYKGLATLREPGTKREEHDVRTGSMMVFWIKDAADYVDLLHESGHAVFGLKDEYCVISASEDITFHSNVFDNKDNCTLLSMHPDRADTCRKLPECYLERWKADSDTCTMVLNGSTQYDLDCQRRAECVVKGVANDEDCP